MEQKIGQLMVFGFSGKVITEELKMLIREHYVGGIILFGRNIGTPKEVLKLTTELQREAKLAGHEYPLFICTDQENGAVRRLGEGATVFPGAMLLGATQNPENAYEIGRACGKELKSLGINWNLSPVLDVNNNANNPVIGVRSFGESAEKVALFGEKAMKGMQDAGIITTLKHFPGHGDTSVDSHLDLPVIDHSLERLEEVELKPFTASIQSGADIIMTAHIYFPALEDEAFLPATLSKKLITGLLREKLKFNGVVTTDCMEMNAISKTVGTAKGAIEFIKAGGDLVMISHSFGPQLETIKEVTQAVLSKEIDESMVDAAFQRVFQLKKKYLKWEDIDLEQKMLIPDFVGGAEHRLMAEKIYRQGITIVKNENNILPLSSSPENKVLIVYPENNQTLLVEDKRYSTMSLGEAIKAIHPSADIVTISNPPTIEEIRTIIKRSIHYDKVIVATLSIVSGSMQITLIEELVEAGAEVIVLAIRNPYDLAYLPTVPVYICTYEFTETALRIAAACIYGQECVTGKLPVTIEKKQ